MVVVVLGEETAAGVCGRGGRRVGRGSCGSRPAADFPAAAGRAAAGRFVRLAAAAARVIVGSAAAATAAADVGIVVGRYRRVAHMPVWPAGAS